MKSLILSILLLSTSMAFAENSPLTAETMRPAKTAPTAGMRDFVVKPFFSIPILELDFESPNDEFDKSVDYEPHISPDIGLSLRYHAFSISGSIPIPESGGDDEVESSYWDQKFDYTTEYVVVELGAHKYKGFAQNDNREAIQDAEVARSDFRKEGRYIDFTLLMLGDELQVDRSIAEPAMEGFHWSPLAQLSYDETKISAEESMLPKNWAEQFKTDSETREAKFRSYILSGGVAGKYRRDSFQMLTSFAFGRSLQNSSLAMVEDAAIEKNRMGGRFLFRTALDYLNEDWIYSFSMMFDRTTLGMEDVQVDSQVGTILLSASTHVGRWL